jgi:diaminopimelate decarboxylase
MEPGRFIVGNAGILVTKVLYVKRTPLKNFIIVDAAMNDLIRPSLYGAYHQILPLRITDYRLWFDKLTIPRTIPSAVEGPITDKADIVGPICESGDFLAKDRLMPKVREGDYLAVMGAGAYGFSMSSNYNSRRRAMEIMVSGNKVFVIRKRETYEDLVRNEKI